MDVETLRADIVRCTAAAGIVLGAVNALQFVVLGVAYGVSSYRRLFPPRWGGALRNLGLWLSAISIVLLLIGSIRLWRGLRGGREVMLAYAITALAGGASLLVAELMSDLPGAGTTPANRIAITLCVSAASLASQAVFPAVVLLVLYRFAPASPPEGAAFEVLPRAED